MSIFDRTIQRLMGRSEDASVLEDEFFDTYLPDQSEEARQCIFDFLVAAESFDEEQFSQAVDLLKSYVQASSGTLVAPPVDLGQSAGLAARALRARSA
jgi:hypothetical protein